RHRRHTYVEGRGLRRRNPRRPGAGAPRQGGALVAGALSVSDTRRAADRRLGRRETDAAEEHVVRAEAALRTLRAPVLARSQASADTLRRALQRKEEL